MGRVIGVFSGKGGVGKTTLVANIATSLTKTFNKNVVVVDTNFSTSHLGMHFGLYEDPKVTLKDVVSRRSPIESAFYIHPTTGVRVLPAPLKQYTDDSVMRSLDVLAKKLKQDNDVVILDAAPGLGKEVLSSIRSIDEAIIVATPDLPSVTDAMKTVNIIKKVNSKANILGVVINRVTNEKHELTRKEIESATNLSSIIEIPEDKRVPESIALGQPAVHNFSNSEASIAYNYLSGALIGEDYSPSGMRYGLRKMLGLTKKHIVRPPSLGKEREELERPAERKARQPEKSDGHGLKGRLNAKVSQKLRERGL